MYSQRMNINTGTSTDEREYNYIESRNLLRPQFTLKEGWEYVLTDIATDITMQPSVPSDKLDVITTTLSSETRTDPFLASGGGRDIYVLPPNAHTSPHPHVVKFAQPRTNNAPVDGIKQNAHEAHLWSEVPTNDLLPVSAHHCNSKWLIMPLGTPVTSTNTDSDVVVSFLEKAYSILSSRLDRTEFSERNLVVVDSELYMCDYGYKSQLY